VRLSGCAKASKGNRWTAKAITPLPQQYSGTHLECVQG
jgi:hypothetical protein